eukprot:350397-Chlamydomonas_euryale.AAC.4
MLEDVRQRGHRLHETRRSARECECIRGRVRHTGDGETCLGRRIAHRGRVRHTGAPARHAAAGGSHTGAE